MSILWGEGSEIGYYHWLGKSLLTQGSMTVQPMIKKELSTVDYKMWKITCQYILENGIKIHNTQHNTFIDAEIVDWLMLFINMKKILLNWLLPEVTIHIDIHANAVY